MSTYRCCIVAAALVLCFQPCGGSAASVARSDGVDPKLVRTDADFKTATQAWCNNAASAEEKYGHISDWDTSTVTDMAKAFMGCKDFNEPIGDWQTGRVTRMEYMFFRASAFDQPIGNWKTGQVADMRYMFFYARVFNQPIGNWQTGKVTSMFAMFDGASAFDQPIGEWQTGQVISMKEMFYDASSFNQFIGDWQTGQVSTMYGMFHGTALSGCNAHAAGAFEARGAKPPINWREELCIFTTTATTTPTSTLTSTATTTPSTTLTSTATSTATTTATTTPTSTLTSTATSTPTTTPTLSVTTTPTTTTTEAPTTTTTMATEAPTTTATITATAETTTPMSTTTGASAETDKNAARVSTDGGAGGSGKAGSDGGDSASVATAFAVAGGAVVLAAVAVAAAVVTLLGSRRRAGESEGTGSPPTELAGVTVMHADSTASELVGARASATEENAPHDVAAAAATETSVAYEGDTVYTDAGAGAGAEGIYESDCEAMTASEDEFDVYGTPVDNTYHLAMANPTRVATPAPCSE